MAGQTVITINNRQWQVYLAATYAELTLGLSGLPSILPGTGMLFTLPVEQPVTVTTQKMFFPIDIVFISGQLKVSGVARGISPGLLVIEDLPVRYFLEVNAGETGGISIGDTVGIGAIQTAETQSDWLSSVTRFAGAIIAGAMLVNLSGTMAKAIFGRSKEQPIIYGSKGERLLMPEITGEMPGAVSQAVVPREPRQSLPGKGNDFEFLPDSPEFLAYTIDDIGYRDRIDTAFLQAIARAKVR